MNGVAHEPTAACDAVHCYAHNRDEHGSYLRCGECGHAWATAADLIADTNRVIAEIYRHLGSALPFVSAPEEVTICPQCAHDL